MYKSHAAAAAAALALYGHSGVYAMAVDYVPRRYFINRGAAGQYYARLARRWPNRFGMSVVW